VPIVVGGNLIGAVRVYTSEPWEFTLDDVNFVQALAQIAGGAINMARYVKGLKSSIEVLKTMKEVRTQRSNRKTPYEGVPKSVSPSETFSAPILLRLQALIPCHICSPAGLMNLGVPVFLQLFA